MTSSWLFAWFDQESTHVPSAIVSPSTNIPMSTVSVAATVVDMLAPSERSASPTTTRNLIRSLRGARRA